MLVPDYPVTCADRPEVTRLRQLVRQGLTVLVGDDVDVAPLQRGLDDGPVEVDVRRMSELSPSLVDMLGARPDEAWLLRPDGHVAAVVPGDRVTHTVHALRRLLAQPLSLPV